MNMDAFMKFVEETLEEYGGVLDDLDKDEAASIGYSLANLLAAQQSVNTDGAKREQIEEVPKGGYFWL